MNIEHSKADKYSPEFYTMSENGRAATLIKEALDDWTLRIERDGEDPKEVCYFTMTDLGLIGAGGRDRIYSPGGLLKTEYEWLKEFLGQVEAKLMKEVRNDITTSHLLKDKTVRIFVEIPHQLPAKVYSMRTKDYYECASMEADQGDGIQPEDGQSYDDALEEYAAHDLHGFHVFDSWKEAFAWANPYGGHQWARVLGQLRREFQDNPELL